MARNYYGDKDGRGLHYSIKGLYMRMPHKLSAGDRSVKRHDKRCDNLVWNAKKDMCDTCGMTGQAMVTSKRLYKLYVVHKAVSTRNRRRRQHGRARGGSRTA